MGNPIKGIKKEVNEILGGFGKKKITRIIGTVVLIAIIVFCVVNDKAFSALQRFSKILTSVSTTLNTVSTTVDTVDKAVDTIGGNE